MSLTGGESVPFSLHPKRELCHDINICANPGQGSLYKCHLREGLEGQFEFVQDPPGSLKKGKKDIFLAPCLNISKKGRDKHKEYLDQLEKATNFFPEAALGDNSLRKGKLGVISVKQPLLALNKTPSRSSPYVLYSSNGIDYTVKTSGANYYSGTKKDAVSQVRLPETARKASLHGDIGLFMGDSSVTILECGNLQRSNSVSHFTWKTPGILDVVPPFRGTDNISILTLGGVDGLSEFNTCNTASPAPTLGKYDSLLEVLDISQGKTLIYPIRGTPSTRRPYRICSTWHPSQFICATSKYFSVIDIREASNSLFWQHDMYYYQGKEEEKAPRIVLLQQARPNKIAICRASSAALVDMRNLRDPFCVRRVPLREAGAVLGPYLAMYNGSGKFFFQSTISQYAQKFRNFQFLNSSKYGNDVGNTKYSNYPNLLAFDLAGMEGGIANTGASAFLFADCLRILHQDPGIPPRWVVHPVSYHSIPEEGKPKSNTESAIKDIEELSYDAPNIIKRRFNLFPGVSPDEYFLCGNKAQEALQGCPPPEDPQETALLRKTLALTAIPTLLDAAPPE